MAITSTAIGSTDTDILTVPGGKSYAVLTIMICNTEAPNPVHQEHGETNFDMHFVPSGGAKSDTNMVIKTLSITDHQMTSLSGLQAGSENVVTERLLCQGA